jgi:hypothetical protein
MTRFGDPKGPSQVYSPGVWASEDGVFLCKRCPVCHGLILVEKAARGAEQYIANPNRVCRSCDEAHRRLGRSWVCPKVRANSHRRR